MNKTLSLPICRPLEDRPGSHLSNSSFQHLALFMFAAELGLAKQRGGRGLFSKICS